MFLDRLGDEFIKHFDKLILGTKSPQRFEIFNQMGIINELTQQRFFIIPSKFKEDLDKSKFPDPRDYVLETATQKALALEKSMFLQHEKDLIVCADTVIIFNGMILEKPKDKADARKTLKLLSGNSHMVCTAVVLRYLDHKNQRVTSSFVEETTVEFMELTDSMVHAYVETGEPMDKAGSYGIQSKGGAFVKRIEGDYYNVVGFPFNRFATEVGKIMDHLNEQGERPKRTDLFQAFQDADLDSPEYLQKIEEMMNQWSNDMVDADILTEAQVNALKAQPKMTNEALGFVQKNLEKLSTEFHNLAKGVNFDDDLNKTFKQMTKSIDSVKDLPISTDAAKAMEKLNKEHSEMVGMLKQQQQRLKEKLAQDVKKMQGNGEQNVQQMKELMQELSSMGGMPGVDFSNLQNPPGDLTELNKMMANLVSKISVDSSSTNISGVFDEGGSSYKTTSSPDFQVMNDDEQKNG
eukprot:g4124.t1